MALDKIFDLRATDEPFQLQALGVDEDGEKQAVEYEPPFSPYCYIPNESFHPSDLKGYDVEFSTDAVDAPFVKVESSHPEEIWSMKWDDDIKTCQADVPYPRRVMIDEDIGVNVPDNEDILFFDIEVDPRGQFPDEEDAEDQILSIGCVGGDGFEEFICDDDEQYILKRFFEIVEDYVVISGWNSLTFDWPYVKNRAKRFNINFNPFEIIHMDLLPLYKHVLREERRKYDLNTVGKDEVDMGKTMQEEDYDEGYEILWKWFQEDRDTLEEYNMEDSRITKALNEKYQLVQILFRIGRRGHCRAAELMYRGDGGGAHIAVGKACDSVILSVANEVGWVFPDKGRYADMHDFPGGKVFEPQPGVYTDVMTADFSGMYPAIIRDINIGPNTWHDKPAAQMASPEKYVKGADDLWGDVHDKSLLDDPAKARGCFDRPDDEKSVLAQAVDRIESLRMEFKQKRNSAKRGSDEWHKFNNIDRGLKVLINSMYGVVASPYHRYYEPGMSENITEVGQQLITRCRDWAEANHPDVQQVVYGDTDSIIFEFDGEDRDSVEVAKTIAYDLNDFVQEHMTDAYNSIGEYMEMDIDEVFSRFLATEKKKKYAGVIIWDDGPTATTKKKGFKAVKADTKQVIADFQMALINAKLDDEPTDSIIDKYKDELYNGIHDTDLIQYTGLHQMPDDYKTMPAHARAAKKIIEREGDKGAVRTGDKIPYVKYGSSTDKVYPADNGLKDFRPNEQYCPECDEIHRTDDGGPPCDHEHIEGPHFRTTQYGYFWSNSFESIMELLSVQEYEQKGLDAFMAATDD